MEKQEGKHYKKREKKGDKQIYSLREIVPEVSGIDESHISFNAVYKDIQRIVEALRKPLGLKGSKMDIDAYQKDTVVEILKSIYNKDEARQTIKRIKKVEEIEKEDVRDIDKNISDLDNMIKIFTDAMGKNSTAEEKKRLENFVRIHKGDEFYGKGEQIKKDIMNDILLIDRLNLEEMKNLAIDDYKNILDKALNSWRKQMIACVKCDQLIIKDIKEKYIEKNIDEVNKK